MHYQLDDTESGKIYFEATAKGKVLFQKMKNMKEEEQASRGICVVFNVKKIAESFQSLDMLTKMCVSSRPKIEDFL